MTKIIAFNSPAGTGKDYVGKALQQALVTPANTVSKYSFKDGLYEFAHAHVRHLLTMEEFMVLCTNRFLKELKTDVLYGMSPREFLIHVSEKQAKILYGENVWVDHLILKMDEHAEYTIITDMGFQNEYDCLEKLEYDITVVQLRRGAKSDFSGDSRNFVNAKKIINIDNNRNIKEVIDEIIGKL